MILFEKRQFRQAETLIERGLVLEPDSALGKFLLGLVQFALNRLPDAERSAHDALLQSAHQTDAYILLAEIHERDHNPYAVKADAAAYLKLDGHGPFEKEANVLLQRAQNEISQNSNLSR
jgi:predicted Zn-dependent protease